MTRSRRGALGGGLAALLIAVVAAACGDDGPTGVQFEVIEDVTYAAEFVSSLGDTFTVDLAQMTETPSGVWIQDLAIGTGDTAVQGDTMFVTYAGWLRDGVEFDAGEFSFIFLDGRTAIGGMHWGTEGQQVGGERLMLIPPEWGYGSISNGPIYPGAVLVFHVVLDSIHPAPVP